MGLSPSCWQREARWDSPAQVVEHHDVGVHVEEVVGVGGVVVGRPGLGLRTLVGEHVVAVLGLVVHAVEARHLKRGRGDSSARAGNEPPHQWKHLRILGTRARLCARVG